MYPNNLDVFYQSIIMDDSDEQAEYEQGEHPEQAEDNNDTQHPAKTVVQPEKRVRLYNHV